MIVRLRGKLLELDEAIAVIEVGGVGYEVEVTTGAAAGLAAAPDQALVFTHLVARDSDQSLYGFATVAERDLFRALIKVSGVGPKLAVALLSAVSPSDFASAVASGDITAMTRVPGIGKKTASRLLMELRDRVDALPAAVIGANPVAREAVLALVALGYRETASARVVGEVANAAGDDAQVEDLIREALKRIAA